MNLWNFKQQMVWSRQAFNTAKVTPCSYGLEWTSHRETRLGPGKAVGDIPGCTSYPQSIATFNTVESTRQYTQHFYIHG
jgi:hypothetical protein